MTLFYLLSGAGNDFLALTEPEQRPSPEQIRAWCRRGLSVGADGLFILERRGRASDSPPTPSEVHMDYFNADGRPADLCLNGTRCAARLAFALGWAQGKARIHTGAGEIGAFEIDTTTVRLERAPLPDGPPEELSLRTSLGEHRGLRVTVGVPHFVLLVDDVSAAPVTSLGPLLRSHEVFAPAGTNVDFVELEGRSRLALRTFERGVESETLACGTGVLAAVAAGLHSGLLALPAVVATRGGFELEIDGVESAGRPRRWSLSGDARLLARGELLAGAALLPQPSPVC